MQTISAIHNPHLLETPSQRMEADRRRERLARLQKSARVFATVSELTARPADKPESSPTVEDWTERQKKIHAEPWFSIVSEIPRTYPRIETIQRVVAEHFGLTRDDLICARRTKGVVLPRHIAMALCRMLTLKSFPEIGRRFGDRDHTVPLYAFNKIERLAKTDESVASSYETLKVRLGGVVA